MDRSLLGKKGLEAKLACNPHRLFPSVSSPSTRASDDCVVVSIGSENKWEFERHVFHTTSCRIEVFDCTGAALNWSVPAELRSRTTLHFKCMGAPQWRYKTLPQGGAAHLLPVSGTRYESFGWAGLLSSVGLASGSAPTFLKMDCEGCENLFLRELLQTGQHRLLPDQIAVEMHYPYMRRVASNWNRRFADLDRPPNWPFRRLAREMWNVAGFSIIGNASNDDQQCCQEVLFARTKCVAA